MTRQTTGSHTLTLEPQPIADQWAGRCACGEWKATISLWSVRDRDAALDFLRTNHRHHLRAVGALANG